MKEFLESLGLLVLLPLTVLAQLWFLVRIYGMTAIPLGAPHISMMKMYGLVLLISAMTISKSNVTTKGTAESVTMMARAILGTIGIWGVTHMLVGFGWL